MRKTKGYAKGGAKMMRARGGKMAKGYAKGGAKMIKAMGGRMASKGGAKMMRAMGGKMAKGYSKGGVKMMRAQKGGIKDPKEFLTRAKTLGGAKAYGAGMNQKNQAKLKNLMKGFNEFLTPLPITASKKSLIKKGIKKLVMPAMKNLGTIKPSKVKTIKNVRGLKKKK